MINLDCQQLSGLITKNLQPNSVGNYIAKIKDRNQGFIDLPDKQEDVLRSIEKFYTENKNKFQYFCLLGIGGSALATFTLNYCLKNSKNLFILDNIDPDEIADFEEQIDLKSTLFFVVSKSGNTVETLSHYMYFRKKIEQQKLEHNDHFVFITDENNGFLRGVAQELNTTTFTVPTNVGGRFSGLSPVSLLPAIFLNINIRGLLEGALKAKENFFNLDPLKNNSFKIAKCQYELAKKNVNITVLYHYSTYLGGLAPWYAQLLAESIGKDGVGITSMSAKGVTDQHSQNQLFHDGPKDKLILFLTVKKFKNYIEIPCLYPTSSEIGFLNGSTFNQLLDFEMKATRDSLTSKNVYNMSLEIETLNEFALGELMMTFMNSIAFLGELFNINAYNQPGVELTKQLTRKYYD